MERLRVWPCWKYTCVRGQLASSKTFAFAMPIPSINFLEMSLLASGFSSFLPHVTCGQLTSRVRYQTRQQLPWCPDHGHTSYVASPTKNYIVILAIDVNKIQTAKKTWGSDMVAKGMMKAHATH